MSSQADVLVVGAGPVGLAAALGLVLEGINVRIIDKLPIPTNQSRAAIVHARTIEHLQRIGVVDDFLEIGVKVHGVSVYGPGRKLLFSPSLDHIASPFPYMLGLEQFKTEEILTARLAKRGVTIERSVELVSFKDTGDHVSVQLRHADGTEEQTDVPWLIGGDGGHSTVRAGLGLHLEGATMDATWITADVKIRWDRDPGQAIAALTQDGIVFIAAMNEDRWRVIVNTPGMTKEQAAAATYDDVEAAVKKRLETDLSFYDGVWISSFGINTRMARTMNIGRVFLCGDAAHVHSPVGGQGMNTGIQDALNLAWKLALVTKGQAKRELLDSFNAERHKNAENLLKGVGVGTKMAGLRNPVAIELRNHFVHLIGNLALIHFMPRVVAMLNVGYPESPIVAESHVSWHSRGPRAGERAPAAHGLLVTGKEEPAELFDLWSGDPRHQLLVFSDRDIDVPTSPLYNVLRIAKSGTPSPGVAVDADGEAYEAYGAHAEGAHYLVRPDGVIAFRDGSADFAEMQAYLARWFL